MLLVMDSSLVLRMKEARTVESEFKTHTVLGAKNQKGPLIGCTKVAIKNQTAFGKNGQRGN